MKNGILQTMAIKDNREWHTMVEDRQWEMTMGMTHNWER